MSFPLLKYISLLLIKNNVLRKLATCDRSNFDGRQKREIKSSFAMQVTFYSLFEYFFSGNFFSSPVRENVTQNILTDGNVWTANEAFSLVCFMLMMLSELHYERINQSLRRHSYLILTRRKGNSPERNSKD